MRPLLARVLDHSRLVEFKGSYGKSIVAGFAWIDGHPVGVLGNSNPRLCAQGARKAAQFVSLCAQRRLPIVFFQDVLGFDQRDGEAAMLKEASLLLRAVACAEVPKLAVTVGKAVGPASYAMCGRALSPRFSFMWPTASVLMASDDQLAQLVDAASLRPQSSALFGAARMWFDDVVSPPHTRTMLSHCLDIAQHSAFHTSSLNFGVFRF